MSGVHRSRSSGGRSGTAAHSLAEDATAEASPEAPESAGMVSRDRDATQGVREPHVGVTVAPSPDRELQEDGLQRSSVLCGGYTLCAWLSLALLVLQNSSLTLCMRWSRLQTGPGGQLYLASSAVVVCEGFKVLASLCIILAESRWSWAEFKATLHNDICKEPMRNLPVLIPAGLYTLQNNLQYTAASNLDPAVFQVLYQSKLVTTALMYVVFMKKSLSGLQWFAVVLLTTGVVLVQLAGSATSAKARRTPGESAMIGCGAVVIACLTSAAAGLYLEHLVKFTRPSVWVRNLQLGTFGLVLGTGMGLAKDSAEIRTKGFFVGFNSIVWLVIFLQSFGGLLTAVVVKHADNVIKGFATGLAIIVSCLFSALFFGFVVTGQYVVGAAVVITSVFFYTLHQRIEQWLTASVGRPNGARVGAVAVALVLTVAAAWLTPAGLSSRSMLRADAAGGA
eukprot:TRINITY_DN70426_c0_g1_i1.p1 TRINITY_DN70426_c0_g1~~TRINITY_DN70426_c0_g1_i1.p1  ORF type:complete len:451 (+),score=154.04 TRINITY_DN70426_c0_g1_i1:200-1552(+)